MAGKVQWSPPISCFYIGRSWVLRDQHSQRFLTPSQRCTVHWKKATFVTKLDICTILQKRHDAIDCSSVGSSVQRSLLQTVTFVRISTCSQ
eukprot:Skav212173  [mRNA]  locus=scaffold754:315603:318085:- [translate_table: standard]